MKELPKGKKIAIGLAGSVIMAVVIAGVAYALLATDSGIVDNIPFVREERIIRSFDLKVLGDIGEHTVIDPGSQVITSNESSEATITVEPEQVKTLEGENFSTGDYKVYQIQNPVLSDGSMLILSQAAAFSLETTPASSIEATQVVEVNLTRIEVGEMTQQQLFHSAERLRAAGNDELADELEKQLLIAPVGESDDGSAKPENWADSDLNPHKDKVWKEAVTEEARVVIKEAWTETVTVGGTLGTYYWCTCGAGPWNTADGLESHRDIYGTWQYIEEHDAWLYMLNGHGYDVRNTTVGGTPQQVHHPAQYSTETRIVSSAGWYAK
jgi:hypothetical protein